MLTHFDLLLFEVQREEKCISLSFTRTVVAILAKKYFTAIVIGLFRKYRIIFLRYESYKHLGKSIQHTLWFFWNCIFYDRVKSCFCVTFNIIIRHIFPVNFIDIPQVFRTIWRLSSFISSIFINFLEFLTFQHLTGDVRIFLPST